MQGEIICFFFSHLNLNTDETVKNRLVCISKNLRKNLEIHFLGYKALKTIIFAFFPRKLRILPFCLQINACDYNIGRVGPNSQMT